MCNDFRFLTVFGMTEGVLRYVRNDRGRGMLRCRMTGWRWLRSGWRGGGAVFGMAGVGFFDAGGEDGGDAGRRCWPAMLGWILGWKFVFP